MRDFHLCLNRPSKNRHTCYGSCYDLDFDFFRTPVLFFLDLLSLLQTTLSPKPRKHRVSIHVRNGMYDVASLRLHACRWKILEEILKWDCDVLVLQEVDHHHDWLSPMLAKEGYRSLFVKKPVAPGMAFNPHLEDGCSLFYRAKATAPRTSATATATPADEGRASGEQEAVATTATTPTTTLDLLDAHTFTLAVVEADGSAEDGEGAGDDGKGGQKRGSAEPVTGNQVAIISLLSMSSDGGVDGCDAGEETLVIVSTTHLKAVKDAHGETIRARQVGVPSAFWSS